MEDNKKPTAEEALAIATVGGQTLPTKYMEHLMDDIYQSITEYATDGYTEADIYFHIDDFITYTQRRYILFQIENRLKEDGYVIKKMCNGPEGNIIMHISFEHANEPIHKLISKDISIIFGSIILIVILYAIFNR